MYLVGYLSGFITAVAVFRKPNAISLCFSIDLVPNFLFSWLLVFLSTFFLDLFLSVKAYRGSSCIAPLALNLGIT